MNKPLKYSLNVLKWAAIILAVIYISVWLYVFLNKKQLIAKIITNIHERTKGEVIVKDLSVSFLVTFPYFSFQIEGLRVRDSLYLIHKQDLFAAESVFARINPFYFITSGPLVSKVIAENGSVFLFSDTTGNSNQYVLQSDISDKKESPVYPDIKLKKMHLVLQSPAKSKLYDFNAELIECKFNHDNREVLGIKVKTKIQVKSLAFNTRKGSFLENKYVQGKFDMQYDKLKKLLSFKDIVLNIEKHPFRMSGNLNMDTSKVFNLQINTDKIWFTDAVGLLPFTLSKKVLVYQLQNPISAIISIEGTTKPKNKPKVTALMNTTNNTVTIPLGKFTNASFKSSFTNQVVDSLDRVDENSAITITDFTAQFEEIGITSKQIRISNLQQPFLDFDMESAFDLVKLNDLIGSTTMQFEKGTSKIDVHFKGPVTGMDTINSSMTGQMTIKDGLINYIPRGVEMTNCNGMIRFANNDVFVEKLNTLVGNTQLLMNGAAKNVLSKLDSIPEQMSLQWQIVSPEIHLSDFQSFLKKSSKGTASKKKPKFGRTAGMIDKLFTETDIALNIETPKLIYKKFTATAVNADLLLSSNRMAMRNVALKHAGGALNFNGTIYNGNNRNTVAINTNMVKLDIPVLFTAFNNFGQDGVTNKNLKGLLSANIRLNTIINDKAEVLTDSTRGIIDFLLEKGELNHFEPVEKIGESALKKQNFGQIRFADMKNTLEVNGTAFIINKMEIRSTAITLFIQGVFDTKKGTDMSIEVPLRNILKNQENTDLSQAGHKGGGISVRLRAKTAENGKLKVSWDPFRKSIKNKKEVSDSTSTIGKSR